MTQSTGLEKTANSAAGGSERSRPHTIHSCNFRYAGRLSNENARALTALHEKFALNVTTALELFLGASLHLKLISLEQMAIVDHISGIAPSTFVLPCALNIMECNVLIEMEISLVFPVIDLLLGGAGAPCEDIRELTEIDEDIVQSVTAIIAMQLERSWQTLKLSVTPGRCIKPTLVPQIFLANEKLVTLMFEMTVGSTTGLFNIVLPTSFVGFLLRHLKAAQSKKMSSLRAIRNPSLRERILDCDFTVSADITQIRALVKDLIELTPGKILKMKAPVKAPGRITVEDVEIFDILPVRNGTRKAAQLLSRTQESAMTRE